MKSPDPHKMQLGTARMLIQIHTAARLWIKQEQTYMYTSEKVTVMTIFGAARKMIKICTNHNSDLHEYHLGPHENEITLKMNRK